MEFPGGGGSTARPSGTENPGGWGGQTGKTLRGGGMDIFWNHTLTEKDHWSCFLWIVYCFLVTLYPIFTTEKHLQLYILNLS